MSTIKLAICDDDPAAVSNAPSSPSRRQFLIRTATIAATACLRTSGGLRRRMCPAVSRVVTGQDTPARPY